ncbi:hypothetical protein OPV22_018248 [Ensete ventricosum]|uniref:TPX2 C-terminal domain-containing protein n=1 Tax=Ensete ventricosum TaxID=4639 RepID=A0AAV8R452_ENSVE|nr:hypothetical protein OPV22_018248 [Ensete ventricosum]
MEPANIDWKNIESRSVRDEAYENINAPKWLDLAAPDASPVDDDAWFCRPDCKHPKTAEDFKLLATPSPKAKLMRSSSERLPLGERNGTRRDENNLKRRAGIAAPLLPVSPHKPKAAASKKFREDLENQDPNQSTPQRPSRPFGAPKKCNTAKEMIKSSAEKKVEEQREEPKQKKAQPRLKSTLSASNLFSGKDIMNQISEFYHEIKKMAIGRARTPAEETKKEVKKVAGIVPEAEDRKLLTPKKDDASAKKSGKMAVRIEIEKSTALKEVRAYPPTPQRFRNPKATATGRSPLNKPPKSATLQKAIQQEMEQDKEEKKAILPVKGGEDCNRGAAAAADSDTEEGSSADLFWFLKPCTYLVQ